MPNRRDGILVPFPGVLLPSSYYLLHLLIISNNVRSDKVAFREIFASLLQAESPQADQNDTIL